MPAEPFFAEHKSLFWDMDLANISVETDGFIIIKRIILRGGRPERQWMFENFTFQEIRNVLEISREIPDHLKEVYLMALENAGGQ